MPVEIDILGYSCGVVRHGSSLNITLIRSPLNVLISGDSAKSLRNEKLRSQTSLGQTDKDTALARCRGGQRAWPNKKPMLSLSVVTDEEGDPLENEDESEHVWKARDITSTMIIFRYVQKAPDDFRWTIDKTEFDDLLALKKKRFCTWP